jgi:Glycosyl hydrolase family 26
MYIITTLARQQTLVHIKQRLPILGIFFAALMATACGSGSGGGSKPQPVASSVASSSGALSSTLSSSVSSSNSSASSSGLIDYPVTARTPLFEPTGDKTLLIMGQDLVAVGDVTDGTTVYSGGYMDDNDLDDFPVGLTTYLQIKDSLGLAETFFNRGEIKNAELTVTHKDFASTTPILSIGYYMTDESNVQPPLALPLYKDVLDGKYDANLQDLANWIKQKNVPTFLRIGYEFNGSWNKHYLNKTGYINVFRYIVSKFEDWGVKNCAYVWQSEGNGTAAELDTYYPGSDYVDWVGYSHFLSNGNGIFELATKYNKPIMIAEASPINFDLDKAGDVDGQPAWDGWFSPLFSHIDNHPKIRALAYINTDWPAKDMWKNEPFFNKSDSRIQTSPYVKAKWITEMQDGTWFTKAEVLQAIGWPLPE